MYKTKIEENNAMQMEKFPAKNVGEASFGDPRSEGMLNKKAGITPVSQTGTCLRKAKTVPLASGIRGITLVALVITVIVLLILAGATVTVALSGEGIFSKADNAVTRWNDKVTQENQATGDLMNILYEMERGNATDAVQIALNPAEGSFGESVTATFSYANIPDGYVLQYLIKEPEAEVTEEDWTTGNTATISVKGTQVRGRLYNGNLSTNKETAVSSWLTVNNIDKTAPTAPTGVETVQNKGNALVLKGTGATDDSGVVYYSYRYKTTSGSWSDWSAKVLSTENYTTGTLELSTDYIIEVKAVDPLNRDSATTYTTPTAVKTAATAPYEGRIGQYVHYAVDLGIGKKEGDAIENSTDTVTAAQAVDDDWVVFYEDTTNGYTYLIAADYVPKGVITSATSGSNGRAGLKQSSTATNLYNVLWHNPSTNLSTNRIPDTAKSGSNRMANYFSSWYAETTTVENEGEANETTVTNGNATQNKQKAAALLMDKANWSSFALTNDIEAYGGPTIELWAASWKQRGYSELFWGTETNTTYGIGYKVGAASNSLSALYNTSNMDASRTDRGINNKVYFPHYNSSGTATDGCYGYWLASPSADRTYNYVMGVSCNGYVNGGYYDYDLFCARPVVSLPSSIIGANSEAEGYTIWYLGNDEH